MNVPLGNHILQGVGDALAGEFHATHLGAGYYRVLESQADNLNVSEGTFDYQLVGLSDLPNGDTLGWGGQGSGTFTQACLVDAEGCRIDISVTYDHYFGTGRFENASGLIDEKVQVIWDSVDSENTYYTTESWLYGWISY